MTVQRHILGTALLALLLAACLPAAAAAMQVPPELTQPQAARPQAGEEGYDLWDEIRDAAVKLPLAAMLGAALALRPRRRGTPPRQAAVVQTQIILAVVGAVIILVVGASLARAFGIVGAANLIRYRSKIEDPKDAVVMLSALAVGLASGAGLFALAVFSTLFLVGALWVIESFEPERQKRFEVTIKAGEDTDALRPRIERILDGHNVSFELRTSSDDEVTYDASLPLDVQVDDVTNALLRLDPEGHAAVNWSEKKVKSK
jgi:uncharacterized membrane protein YhiD involved in acid resistance